MDLESKLFSRFGSELLESRVTTRSYSLIGVCLVALAAPVTAQTLPAAPTQNSPAPLTAPTSTIPVRQWIASGFVGSNSGGPSEGASASYGGSIGRLRRGRIGAEALVGFSPNFHVTNPVLIDNPAVNSYMGNLIGVLPLGAEAQWQPFASAGLGGIQLRSDARDLSSPLTATSASQTRFGGNIGGGLMGYVGNFGVRADIRYFKASSGGGSRTTPAEIVVDDALSGLSFWIANVGVAIRW
jgi:hypothetical protein